METINLEASECFKLKGPTPPLMGVQYSHDGKWIACNMFVGFNNIQVSIVNREDPNDTITYNIKDNSKNGLPSWSLDDKKLAFVNDSKGRGQVVIQEFQGEEKIFLELEKDEEVPWYSQPLWDPKDDKIYYVTSKHSRTTLHSHPIGGQKESALSFPQGTVNLPKISKDGKVLTALHSSMLSPEAIHLYKIGSKFATRLTPKNHKIDLFILNILTFVL